MCGITGIRAFNEIGRFFMVNNSNATKELEHRGPDSQGFYLDDLVLLSHRRLSIQDTSSAGNQPMKSEDENYVIAYNGEVYNFKELKTELEANGHTFSSGTDTEVILKLYIEEGVFAFKKLNGFFALSIYDKQKSEIILARDHSGIKPLYFFHDDDKFIFGSEIKSLLKYNLPKAINKKALSEYFQFNYIPEPNTILENVFAFPNNHYGILKADKSFETYPIHAEQPAKEKITDPKELRKALETAIEKRLIADVPVGTFLSGGIDSTIISGIAAQQHDNLHTFSIGFPENKFFDETQYAEIAAKAFGTKHQTFQLSNLDLLNGVNDLFDNMDQPFADSSALPVYLLSRETQKHVKVILSGDGADELFAGYNKYRGEYLIQNPGLRGSLASLSAPLLKLIPKSRNSGLSNKARQLDKYLNGKKLSPQQRYFQWCSIGDEAFLNDLIIDAEKLNQKDYTKHIGKGTINDILKNDQDLVLKNDMLVKVDRMSMLNSLEVRVPFLDKSVIDLASQIPENQKINAKDQKIILKEAFADIIPSELLNRPKHGFEVPLLEWLKTNLNSQLEELVLDKTLIEEQGLFNYDGIQRLYAQLHSNNPEDSPAKIWALIVFQKWYFNVMK